MNYYNENDPFAAAWLSTLIMDGLIPPGVVDERSIVDVQPDDLKGFSQCHFFAGIGGWPLALQIAGVPDDTPLWTGSCPCQPFSQAGQRKGTADKRHLWPEFYRLIGACRPSIVFGEQVASKAGREWLAGVFADLEALAYRRAGADLCAPGVGAPHIRQRLYWMADSTSARRVGTIGKSESKARNKTWLLLPREVRTDGRMGDANNKGPQRRSFDVEEHADQQSPWAASVFIECSDGRYRRVPATEAGLEPTLFPLADAGSIRNRMGALRGSGNAIVPALAAQFIKAGLEAICLSSV